MRRPLEITPETTATSCPYCHHSHPRVRLRSPGSDLTVPNLFQALEVGAAWNWHRMRRLSSPFATSSGVTAFTIANDFFEWKKSFKPAEMTSTAENGPLSGYGIGSQPGRALQPRQEIQL